MKKIFITFICLVTLQSNLFAWGRNGHTIVLSIAYQNLTPANKEIFLKYLNGISIADAASWMDEIKSEPKYDYMRKLHYINLPKTGGAYREGSNDNIVDEIKRIIFVMKNRIDISDSAMRINLLKLYHLVGDIHQPFHTIGEDKGGNDYQVQFNGQGTNLHSVWDSKIIDYSNIKLSDVELLKQTNTKIDVLDWLTESRAIAYDAYPSNHKINDEYVKQYTPIIKQQLSIAGLRLAAILNKYLGGLNPNPVFTKEVVEVAEISIDSVNSWYKGKTVKICTKIFSTKQIETGSKPLLLSVGAEHPYNMLTVVIFNEDLSTFKLNKEKDYKKKKICVTGKIVEYNGQLQIVVKKEEQIEMK